MNNVKGKIATDKIFTVNERCLCVYVFYSWQNQYFIRKVGKGHIDAFYK